jgi:hypothetical protein
VVEQQNPAVNRLGRLKRALYVAIGLALSFRDVEDLLAERGITVSYETIRRWVNHFGPMNAADLRRRRPKPHTTWHLDEGAPPGHRDGSACHKTAAATKLRSKRATSNAVKSRFCSEPNQAARAASCAVRVADRSN